MDAMDAGRFERIVFFTGAGASAESGIPTYRGRGGVWTKYDWQEIACQEAFERDPEKVWDYHDWRRERMGEAEPNAGHRIVAAVARERPGTVVVTQNIDGLHQRAGAENVIELHGSVWRVRCDAEGKVWQDENIPLPSRRCACGGWLRPDIVWFGDALDPAVVGRATQAIQNADLFVSVGTSAVVYPAAQFPMLAANAKRVEINPDDTPLSALYDTTMRTTASEGLARLFPTANT